MFNDSLEQVMRKDFRCVVARWIDSLSEEDQLMIAKAIQEHNAHVVYKASRNYGYQGGETAFAKHAKQVCACSNMK